MSPHDARRNTATQSGVLSHGLWVTITHNTRLISPEGYPNILMPLTPSFNPICRQGDDGSIGPIGSTRMPDAVSHHTCIKSSTEYELGLILKEIRFITDQVSAFVVIHTYPTLYISTFISRLNKLCVSLFPLQNISMINIWKNCNDA